MKIELLIGMDAVMTYIGMNKGYADLSPVVNYLYKFEPLIAGLLHFMISLSVYYFFKKITNPPTQRALDKLWVVIYLVAVMGNGIFLL
jgi:hypothetical protein